MMTSEQAFNRLKEGNSRYAAGATQLSGVTAELRSDLFINGQFPYAVIVGCSDSRVPAELVFDAGPGELFIVRTAGNIVGPLQMGSIEFAVMNLKAPLVVVLGHQKCGAVVAATTDGKFTPSLQAIVDEIRCCAPNVVGSNPDIIEDENIRYTLSKIADNPNISKAVSEGALRLVAAKYSLETGVVSFF
jgi:carbonic anhydrase